MVIDTKIFIFNSSYNPVLFKIHIKIQEQTYKHLQTTNLPIPSQRHLIHVKVSPFTPELYEKTFKT